MFLWDLQGFLEIFAVIFGHFACILALYFLILGVFCWTIGFSSDFPIRGSSTERSPSILVIFGK